MGGHERGGGGAHSLLDRREGLCVFVNRCLHELQREASVTAAPCVIDRCSIAVRSPTAMHQTQGRPLGHMSALSNNTTYAQQAAATLHSILAPPCTVFAGLIPLLKPLHGADGAVVAGQAGTLGGTLTLFCPALVGFIVLHKAVARLVGGGKPRVQGRGIYLRTRGRKQLSNRGDRGMAQQIAGTACCLGRKRTQIA